MTRLRAPHRLHNRLRLSGTGFADDRGDVLPVFCHFGEAFSAFTRRPDEVRRQLEAIATAGYHGIRFWDVLGYYASAWRGREVTPLAFANRHGVQVAATSRYYESLRAFLLACHERGLAVMHDRGDLNDWSGEQRQAHMGTLGALYRDLGPAGPEVLAGLWACNEGYQNGVTTPEDAAEMLYAFAAGAGALPDVRGLSAPQINELHDLRAWSASPATVVTIHPSRLDDPFRRLQHVFDNGYERCVQIGKPGWNTEPIGPGVHVSVAREQDPTLLGALAAMSLIARQAWTYMSSPGVIWDRPIEDQPAFATVPALCRMLPQDVMQFARLAHAGDRWQQVRPLVAERGSRFDFAIHDDGRFAGVAYGAALRGLAVARDGQFRVLHPATFIELFADDLAAGARLPLDGPARVVVGRVTGVSPSSS